MTTIKRLFVAGAFWLVVKVLRISPAALEHTDYSVSKEQIG